MNPDRAVGLQGQAIGFSEREIEGATCVVIRQVGTLADAHLGQVSIETPRTTLNLGPVFDAARGGHRYLNSPETGPCSSTAPATPSPPGPAAACSSAPSSCLSPPPPPWTACKALIALRIWPAPAPTTAPWSCAGPRPRPARRGTSASSSAAARPSRPTWSTAPSATTSSRPSWPTTASCPAGGLLRRRRGRERHLGPPGSRPHGAPALGPHSVEMVVGRRTQIQEGGRLEPISDVPPFQITEPSPNVRDITPGEPLRVAWSALPAGTGPLVVALTTYDGERDEARQVSCAVPDPQIGAIELPADFTEDWPMGEADLRQLAVRYDLAVKELPAPDRGRLTQSITVLLKLNP
ncbi:MAG: hypothetical protein R3F43_05100 [bacterium]